MDTMIGTPDPEENLTWDEQVQQYRNHRERVLTETVNTLKAPINNFASAAEQVINR